MHQLEEEQQLEEREKLKKVKKSARPTKTSACKKAAKPKRVCKPSSESKVREFLVREVSWRLHSYRDFLDGADNITEPPVTLRMTIEEIEGIAANPSQLGLEEIPCHTQSVERMIALVTHVSKSFPTGERFEQEVSNCLFSRNLMPQFKSKQDYCCHLKDPERPERPRRASL